MEYLFYYIPQAPIIWLSFELFDIDCRYNFFVKSLNYFELLVNQ